MNGTTVFLFLSLSRNLYREDNQLSYIYKKNQRSFLSLSLLTLQDFSIYLFYSFIKTGGSFTLFNLKYQLCSFHSNGLINGLLRVFSMKTPVLSRRTRIIVDVL